MKKLLCLAAALISAAALTVSACALTIFESRYIGGVEYKMLTDITRYEEKYQDENKFFDTDIKNVVKIYHDDGLWRNLRQENTPETTAQVSTAYYTAKDGSFGKSEFVIKNGDVDIYYDGFSSDIGTDEAFRSIFTADGYESSDGTKRIINDLYYFKGKSGAAVVCYYTPGGVFTDIYPDGPGGKAKVFRSLDLNQLGYLSMLEKNYSKEHPDGDFYETLKADGFEIPEKPEYVLEPDEPQDTDEPAAAESNSYFDTPDNSAMLAIYMMLFLIAAAGISAIAVVIKDRSRSDKSGKITKK